MLNLDNLKAGRIYSFKHSTPVEIKQYALRDNPDVPGKQYREYSPEWLHLVTITKNGAFKGNCACPTSYRNLMLKDNPQWQPSPQEAWFQWTEKPGIVVHKTTLKPYLALIKPKVIKAEYFVNGKPATPAQEAEIKEWKKGSKDNEERKFGVFDLLEKVECEGEVLDELN